jgi:hypothetical protein
MLTFLATGRPGLGWPANCPSFRIQRWGPCVRSPGGRRRRWIRLAGGRFRIDRWSPLPIAGSPASVVPWKPIGSVPDPIGGATAKPKRGVVRPCRGLLLRRGHPRPAQLGAPPFVASRCPNSGW